MKKIKRPQAVIVLTTIYAIITGFLFIRAFAGLLLSFSADKSGKYYFINYIDWSVSLIFATTMLFAVSNFYKMKKVGKNLLVFINWAWMILMVAVGLAIPIGACITTKSLYFSVATVIPVLLFLVPAAPAYILNMYLNDKSLVKVMK